MVRADDLMFGMTVRGRGTVLDVSGVFHGHVLVLWLHPTLAEHRVERNAADDLFAVIEGEEER